MGNIEEHIRQAMAEGKFDNLPGQGKPLHLEDNPYEDPEWRLAYHALRSSGFTLPWIETRRSLEGELELARSSLQRTWDWRQTAVAEGQPAHFVQAVWEQAVILFCQRIEAFNQHLLSYNLEVPHTRFQLPRLDIESEIEKISAHHPE